jgi:hypothetical protein
MPLIFFPQFIGKKKAQREREAKNSFTLHPYVLISMLFLLVRTHPYLFPFPSSHFVRDLLGCFFFVALENSAYFLARKKGNESRLLLLLSQQ